MTEVRQGPTPRVRFSEVSVKRELIVYIHCSNIYLTLFQINATCLLDWKNAAYQNKSWKPPPTTTSTAGRGTHDSTSAERAETAGRGVLRDGTEASGCTWTLEPWLESQGLPLRDDRIQISGSRVTTCRTAGKDGDLYHTGKREELR